MFRRRPDRPGISDNHGGALYVDLTDWLPPEVTFSLTSGQPDLDSPRILIARRIDQLRKEVLMTIRAGFDRGGCTYSP